MDAPFTLSFEEFWKWLTAHPNCILRAGTPESAVYDHESMHWSFSTEGTDHRFVQLIKGKQLIGEILVAPELVTYVQGVPSDVEDEFVFELVSEGENDHRVFYFFVMTHNYEDEESAGNGQVH